MDVSKVHDKNQVAETKLRSATDVKTQKTDNAKDKVLSELGSPTVRQSTTERVTWSPDAGLAMEALDAVKSAPDARADKVASLKAAIKNGTYKVDSGKIADSMIAKSLEDDLITRKGS